MDNEKYGWVLGALGIIFAGLRELWGIIRQRRSEVRRDEITFLTLRMEEMERNNALCERRCDELREDVMNLLAHIHEIAEPPKRKRKTAAQ